VTIGSPSGLLAAGFTSYSSDKSSGPELFAGIIIKKLSQTTFGPQVGVVTLFPDGYPGAGILSISKIVG